MRAKLCIIFCDVDIPTIVVEIWQDWCAANALAQKLNQHLQDENWYFKAIGFRDEDN